ncbi:MAG TPA: acyl-CoA dehydrogenase family protein [Burkholderiaceae bacterium]|nr:acyl-CoA dehydrogenase family protein [Burkholderiaceae bacterium]
MTAASDASSLATAGSSNDDESARLLTDSATRLFAQESPPARLRQAETDPSVATDLWRRLDEQGLSLACASEANGGSALGWSAVRGLIEACGEHGLPVALPEMLAAHLLARAAGLSLPTGRRVTLALARREDNQLVADAVAGAVDAQDVLIEVDGRLVLLEVASASAAQRRNTAGEPRTGLRWSGAERLLQNSVAAGQELLLAGAAIRCGQIAGAARRVVDMSVGYANDRVQFGRPIGKFQAVQQQLAVAAEWSAMAAMASRLALAEPGIALPHGRVAAAREVACSAAEQVCGVAHAVHGAIGVTAEYDLQLFTRRLKGWAAEFGSSRYWASRLGREVLANGGHRVWDQVVALTPT